MNTGTIQDFDDQSLGYQDSGERTPCLSRDALEDDQGGQDAASESGQEDLADRGGCGGSLGGCRD